MVPVLLRAWPGVLTLDNHGTGKYNRSPGQTWTCPSWAWFRNWRNNQRARGQWHIRYSLSSYSPRVYLLLQITAFLKRREKWCWQRGFKSPREGKHNASDLNSSQHLLPNRGDVVNWINSFNKDDVTHILSRPGARANYRETRHPPPAEPARLSPPCTEDAEPGIYCGSAKSRAGGRTSIFLQEGCWATGKLLAGHWRLHAHARLLHHSQLTWFWWINIRWKSTALLSLSPQHTGISKIQRKIR